jgi:hypothetical protein
MTSYKLKQIGLALCLMVSLLFGSAAACTCSHHQEKPQAHEMSCHGSHHGVMADADASNDGNAVDAGCVCFVDQPTPAITSKSESKKLGKSISNSDRVVPDLEFVAAATVQPQSPDLNRTLSYSSALRSLLPARAPPRL